MAKAVNTQYSFPINVMNIINWDYNEIDILEVILLSAFTVKAASFGNGFFYSIADVKREFGVNRRRYKQLIEKLELIGAIEVEQCKAKRQKIHVNFDNVTDESYIDVFIKNDPIGGDSKKELVRKVTSTFSKHEKDSKAATAAKDKKRIHNKAVDEYFQSFVELFNRRRKMESEKDGGKKYSQANLVYTQNQIPKIKGAIEVFQIEALEQAGMVYFDKIIKGVIEPRNIVDYFFQKDSNGNYKYIIECLDYFNNHYSIQK